MQPVTIVVSDAFGENLLTPDEGEELRTLIHDDLVAGRDVTLDFARVRIVVSAFLNVAIGRLYEDITADVIKKHLSITNLGEAGLFTLKSVVDNAKNYYSDKRFRDAVDASVEATSEDS